MTLHHFLDPLLCGFCNAAAPVWRYTFPAYRAIVANTPINLPTVWPACGSCAALVEAGDIDGLMTVAESQFLTPQEAVELVGAVSDQVLSRALAGARRDTRAMMAALVEGEFVREQVR